MMTKSDLRGEDSSLAKDCVTRNEDS